MLDLTTLWRTGHGWLGILAVALLLHPVLAPGAPRRRGARWSLGLAITLTIATFTTGWLLYPGYRQDPKPALLRLSPGLAAAFETKEHLAWYVLVLAVGGGTLAWISPGPTARRMLAAAAVLGMVVAGLGAVVSAFNPGK